MDNDSNMRVLTTQLTLKINTIIKNTENCSALEQEKQFARVKKIIEIISIINEISYSIEELKSKNAIAK